MFQAFGNIARIPELRKKLFWTMGLLILFRLGSYIPLPGVNLEAVRTMLDSSKSQGSLGQFVGMLDMFAGGALERVSIFALGIMPYISASIIFQILTAIVPALQKVSKEGESGRRKINQWTRYSTVALCIFQALIICSTLQNQPAIKNQAMVLNPGLGFLIQSAIILSAGTAFLMWLGEQIDEFGLGNGISLIIMVGIISRLPQALEEIVRKFDPAIDSANPAAIGPSELFLLAFLFLVMVTSVVFVTEATRRIPMQTPKRSRMGFRQQHYLPLKLNASGVIAIIFAQALMMLPNFLAMVNVRWLQELLQFFVMGSYLYMTFYLLLIVFFSYFYTAVIFDPKEHAENFKQYGMFVPGIRPGNDTRAYLETVMNRITFAGAVFIAIIAIVPQIIQSGLKVGFTISDFFGGTGLLIVVGVALDLINRIESHMLMERYDGFLKSGGRIRGRRGE
ncbi:MAG: preprotein translocase subunit SecY [Planctomycetota bacterium]|nr:preprotein translocase subunit SecY [Planctomycetota bacterium]